MQTKCKQKSLDFIDITPIFANVIQFNKQEHILKQL